ncbi:MAG: gamma-glutamyl-gamma-aminobutyrate hydrolase family protein, partial [Planctomycetota bacterium]
MSDKPVVGLTARTLPLQAARKSRPTETVARSYIEPLEAEGALVLLLPNCESERAGEYVGLLDGLLLTGGDDPHAHLFGEEPHPNIEMVDERRDRFEIALVRAARALQVPVLGL